MPSLPNIKQRMVFLKKPSRKVVICSLFSIAIVISYLFYNAVYVKRKTARVIAHKIIHLDLKGAPPKIDYLKSLLPLFKNLGATGILIEYEDMFPYQSTLANISALNAYTRSAVEDMIKSSKDNGLELIPLVQTFGHLEYLLKLEEFAYLRERPWSPFAICPSHPDTGKILEQILEQMLSVHPDAKFIHIGADEVPLITNEEVCSQCWRRLTENDWNRDELFLRHVKQVTEIVRSKRPDIKILTWDDGFRRLKGTLLSSVLKKSVEPVVWSYGPELPDRLTTPKMWKNYARAFGDVWIATAFKGATSPDAYYTDIRYHIANHEAWSNLLYNGVLSDFTEEEIHVRGIIFTGWQRYDHFATLCELLPASIPSLAACLEYIGGNTDFNKGLRSFTEVLECKGNLLDGPLRRSSFVSCSYPGYHVYEVVKKLQNLRRDFDKMNGDTEFRGWLSDYNIKHKFASPIHVASSTKHLVELKTELFLLKQDAINELSEIYDNSTVQEWIDINLVKFEEEVNTLHQVTEELLLKTYWPRRPL